MKTRKLLFAALGCVLCLQAVAASITIDYEYNSVRVCVGATARLEGDGAIIGKAKLEKLVKGEYYEVRLFHYSRSGEIIYEGVAKFSIYGGSIISERKVRGEKRVEIFSTWPG